MAAKATRRSLIWLKASGGETVEGAIVAGSTGDGAELHIARAQMEHEELAPGKLHIGYECAFIPLDGAEQCVDEYEVLSNAGDVEVTWVSASNGEVPVGAVEGGRGSGGDPIYLTRCPHEGDMVPGKLVPHTDSAYVPWGGKEYAYKEYEVMCVASVKPLVPRGSGGAHHVHDADDAGEDGGYGGDGSSTSTSTSTSSSDE